MNEKDAIKDLFSNAFEQHTSAVRPEVWQGLQSKMAAAGMAGSTGAAVKGISALTKWIIGGAAVVGTATITTVALLHTDGPAPVSHYPVKQNTAENTAQPDTQEQTSNNYVAQAHPKSGATPQNGIQTDRMLDAVMPIDYIDYSEAPAENPGAAATGVSPATTPSDNRTTPPVSVTPPAKADNHLQGSVTPSPNSGGGTGSPTPAMSVAAITFVPNTFTPNYDGNNDVFFIQSENITDFSVFISDAQGKLVFKSADPDFKWDGSDLNGSPVPAGQYRCVIIASGTDKKPLKRQEIVVVSR